MEGDVYLKILLFVYLFGVAGDLLIPENWKWIGMVSHGTASLGGVRRDRIFHVDNWR